MAYTTIDDPTIYFNTKLYTANASAGHAITGVGHQPDWLWIKQRSNTYNHEVFDSVRGATKRLLPNDTDTETTVSGVTSFDSDGFTLGDAYNSNKDSGDSIVAWSWKAGTSFTNDTSATGVGTIDSTGSINTTAGFSIISYSGTGTAGTIAHGLGSTPKVIIVKVRNFATNWLVQHANVASTKVLYFDTTNAATTDSVFNDTLPTSSVFSVKTANGINASGKTYIAYCFSEIKGYSKFGKYTGNGNADGTFIYTGFLPAWIMVKPIDATQNWQIHDLKRLGYNVKNYNLSSNNTAAEAENDFMDILSNGFKIRRADVLNVNDDRYIYWAFAESPFVNSNGVPNNAR